MLSSVFHSLKIPQKIKMNRNSLPILLIFVTTHFLLPKTSLCEVDPKFEACVPKTCGDDQNISFPFSIDGRQEEFCGDPRFRIVCNKNGKPTINLFRDNYTINNISYHDQSIRVSAGYLDLISNTCYPPITNLTPLPVGSRFQIDPAYTQLHFYTDCISPLPNNLTSYMVNCSTDNGTSPILAVLGADTDTRLKYVSRECRSTVATPVEVYKDEKIGGGWEEYNKVMRRGFVLNWIASNCSACIKSGGRCGFDADTYLFQCFCPDGPRGSKCPPENYMLGKLKLVLGIGCPIILLTCLLFLVLWCHYKQNSRVFWKKETENHRRVEVFLRNNFSLAPKRYSYSDIKKMTSSFKDKLGQGGYGGVYKGRLHDGRLVAVKFLNKSKGDGEEFLNEVASISKTSHVNIVTLEGFCFQGSKRALIYEFMPNGSLEKFIHDKNQLRASQQLGWETLYQIAVGIARGLEYLHRGCNTRILHFDIKPHNILLDENFCPKISDFGLAKLCPEKGSIISMMGARGTAGYIAPEVFFRSIGGVSHKSDVYSYGMMVLEIVGGRKSIDDGVEHTSETYFPHWIYRQIELGGELGLQRVKNEEEDEKVKKMILVGLWCIQTDPSNRPSMARVVEMLHGRLGCLQIPPKPFLFSPLRPSVNSSTSSIIVI